MNEDNKVISIIERKIEETVGEEQKLWVHKYDVFTNRYLYKEYNISNKLQEVEEIKKEVLGNE